MSEFVERLNRLNDKRSLMPSLNEYLLQRLLFDAIPELIEVLKAADEEASWLPEDNALRLAFDALNAKAREGKP